MENAWPISARSSRLDAMWAFPQVPGWVVAGLRRRLWREHARRSTIPETAGTFSPAPKHPLLGYGMDIYLFLYQSRPINNLPVGL